MSETVEAGRPDLKEVGEAEPHERRRSPRYRLAIEVSPDLHRRILTICATRRLPVNEAVREVLERAFPG